jgi:3-hydroxyacyl-CoA dehydrogenase
MKVNKAACLGAGVIGSSWATNFAFKGVEVVLYDNAPGALDLAKQRVETNLNYLVKNGVFPESKVKEIMGRVSYTPSIEEAVRDVQFIQESVLENYEAKHALIAEFEKYAPPDAIVASSTSGLLITEIAKNAKHPERFIGAHPYNPPHLIPLVEITKGEKTSPEAVQAGKDFYIAIDKEPVVLNKEALGFISNRLQQAVSREICELVYNRGVCSLEDADKALTFGPGLRWGVMGPNLIFNLGGGKGGMEGLFNMTKNSVHMWLDDMAAWMRYPDDGPHFAQQVIYSYLAKRPAEIGNTLETLMEYRDKMLIELLKLHKKL